MRSLLVAAVLVFAAVPSPALSDVPPARAAVTPSSSDGVRYHELSKMLHRFRLQAEARARVIATR
jgi:hypothetical protein